MGERICLTTRLLTGRASVQTRSRRRAQRFFFRITVFGQLQLGQAAQAWVRIKHRIRWKITLFSLKMSSLPFKIALDVEKVEKGTLVKTHAKRQVVEKCTGDRGIWITRSLAQGLLYLKREAVFIDVTGFQRVNFRSWIFLAANVTASHPSFVSSWQVKWPQ